MPALLFLFLYFCLSVVEAIPRWHQGKLIYLSETVDVAGTHLIVLSCNCPFISKSNVINLETDKFAKTFDQDLDHFNRQIGVTFKQRYFLNDTFWSGASSGAPVFLCVGGEGPPLDWTVLVSSVHCNDMVELAPKYGALLVALVSSNFLRCNNTSFQPKTIAGTSILWSIKSFREESQYFKSPMVKHGASIGRHSLIPQLYFSFVLSDIR